MALNLYPRAMNPNATYFPNQSSQWNTTHDMLTKATSLDKTGFGLNSPIRNIGQGIDPTSSIMQPTNLNTINPANAAPATGMMDSIGGFLQSPAGMMGAGAVTGIVGGLLDNANISSQNKAIGSAVDKMNTQLNDLKKQRSDAVQYRKGEATDFLTSYVTARDPNRSSQIAQMYQSGQERYRNELQSNDQLQSNVNSQIAELEKQKQKKLGFGEIAGQGLVGAAQMLPFALMG